ncbi:flotillin-like FloA family protein [Planctomycetota bacterium]
MNWSPGIIAIIALSVVVALILLKMFLYFFRPWIQCRVVGIPLTFFALVRLKLQKRDMEKMVQALMLTSLAGYDIAPRDFESHYLKGGNLPHIAQALVFSRKLGFDLDFAKACEMDLDPRQDLLEYVKREMERKKQELKQEG